MPGKSFVSSKAVWLNIITMAIGLVSLAQGITEFQQFAPWLLFVSGLLNLVLRTFFTNEAITSVLPPAPPAPMPPPDNKLGSA